MLRKTPDATWIAAIEAMRALDLTADLPRIAVPTLVVAGELDHSLDLSPSGIGLRRIAELVPGAKLVVLDGIGHITIVEAPERHAAAVLEFTASTARV
jgi:pimeloyl-ACP methyl ester carboxylesterase